MTKPKKVHISTPVLPHVFKALERADMVALSQCKEEEIRPILPCLVRMSLIAPIENTMESTAARKAILKILSGIETVNAMVALLSVDFPTLESDFKKEQQLRQKVGGLSSGGAQEGSILVQNLVNGLALEFECCEPLKRLRLLLSEIIYVMAQLKEPRPAHEWYHKECELFDNQCYFEEVADILSIGVSELPGLLSPGELAETLLHFSNAPHLIARIVSNQPDYFKEVLSSIITNGEAQDEDTEGGLMRQRTVRTLCLMNPSMVLYARHLCVELCRMPGLTLYLTLDAARNSISSPSSQEGTSCEGADVGDVVSFVTGLLLSPDQNQRAWFAAYVKGAHKRKWEEPCGLSSLRGELSEVLYALLLFRTTHLLPAVQVIPATALLRLYTALKNLPGFKLHEEKEVAPLLQLLTCQPPVSAAGVKFVSTGLCVLIACPQLLTAADNERRAADWIRWLVKEEKHFSGALGEWSSSFGALLLLVAIHFHVGQLSAVLELVSTALNMRITTKTANLTRIRHIVTHEVFTESVVTLIASKVSVTRGLNAGMPGFLPVHCVYHLLKSRMFTRHKVNIKNWIYRQICKCAAPMHPVLPPLVEVYVRSVLGTEGPSPGQLAPLNTNDPISEAEILAVFELSSFKGSSASKKRTPTRGSVRPRLRNTAGHRLYLQHRGPFSSEGQGGAGGQAAHEPMQVDDAAGVKTEPAALFGGGVEVQCVLTSQLLLLYYLLLYEDLRLAAPQQQFTYSATLFSQLPIRYLLARAQRDQALYGGLYSALIRLLAHHYPQLCLVEDWLYRAPLAPPSLLAPRTPFTAAAIRTAMSECGSSPGLLIVLLQRCMLLPPQLLWNVAAAPLTDALHHLLEEDVPRTVLEHYVLVWRRLNAMYPRRLWTMTVEGLRAMPHPPGGRRRPLTEDDLVLDPLYVLRCDPRVYRRAPLLQLVEYILRVYLLSSRTFLAQHQLSTAGAAAADAAATGGSLALVGPFEEERDKLRNALTLTQESAAVQILLEATLQDPQQGDGAGRAGSLLALQEVQSVVFSYLHQAFIKDTTLAKLVHFQGYPRELIGPVVQGVPSMHVAVGLNWIPELLQLPQQQQQRQRSSIQLQLFTLHLTAQLALQNAMPSTLSIARLAVNVVAALVGVLAWEERLLLVRGALGPLVTLGRVFPCLLPEVTQLLCTSARLSRAHAAILPAPAPLLYGVCDGDAADPSTSVGTEEPMAVDDVKPPLEEAVASSSRSSKFAEEDAIVVEVTHAFRQLVVESAMRLKIY